MVKKEINDNKSKPLFHRHPDVGTEICDSSINFIDTELSSTSNPAPNFPKQSARDLGKWSQWVRRLLNRNKVKASNSNTQEKPNANGEAIKNYAALPDPLLGDFSPNSTVVENDFLATAQSGVSAKKTVNYNLSKPETTDFYDINVQNSNMDIIDSTLASANNTITSHINAANPHIQYATDVDLGALQGQVDAHKAENAVLIPQTGSTENAILLDIVLTDKKKGSFRASANNTGNMTINGKAFKKDSTTQISVGGVKANKVYDFYYDLANDGVFILAKASGTAQPSDVLAGKTFSNDDGEQVGTLIEGKPFAIAFPTNVSLSVGITNTRSFTGINFKPKQLLLEIEVNYKINQGGTYNSGARTHFSLAVGAYHTRASLEVAGYGYNTNYGTWYSNAMVFNIPAFEFVSNGVNVSISVNPSGGSTLDYSCFIKTVTLIG